MRMNAECDRITVATRFTRAYVVGRKHSLMGGQHQGQHCWETLRESNYIIQVHLDADTCLFTLLMTLLEGVLDRTGSGFYIIYKPVSKTNIYKKCAKLDEFCAL